VDCFVEENLEKKSLNKKRKLILVSLCEPYGLYHFTGEPCGAL
jgi:hypothetical protein